MPEWRDLVEGATCRRGFGFVVEAMGVSTAAKKAAFNVVVNNKKLEIGVFNHAVEVENAGEVETVVTGEKLVVGNGSSKISELGRKEKNEIWITENLQDDREYLVKVEKQLLQAKRTAVGLEDAEDVSFGSSIKQDALLFVTFDDVKKKKIELDLAERDFMAAQIKLLELDLSEEGKAQSSCFRR